MSGLRDRLDDLLGKRDGRAWSGSVEDLLYDGERVESSVEVGDSRVVVTGHRVLALTPESAGENFRDVDRPNVTDVRLGAEGDEDLLHRGLRTAVYAVALLAVGFLVDFGSLLPTTSVDTTGAGQVGIGGMLGAMNRFLALFAQLDDLMRLFGALALFLTAVMLGVYAYTRDPLIVVAVAGDEPELRVPAPPDADRRDAAVADLDAALFGAADRGAGDRAGTDSAETDRTGADTPAGDRAVVDREREGDARFKSDGPL